MGVFYDAVFNPAVYFTDGFTPPIEVAAPQTLGGKPDKGRKKKIALKEHVFWYSDAEVLRIVQEAYATPRKIEPAVETGPPDEQIHVEETLPASFPMFNTAVMDLIAEQERARLHSMAARIRAIARRIQQDEEDAIFLLLH